MAISLSYVAAVCCIWLWLVTAYQVRGTEQGSLEPISAQDLFVEYDLNKDNNLDEFEVMLLAFRDQIGRYDGFDVINNVITRLFKILEQDGNGRIDLAEFQTLQSDPAIFATNAEIFGMFQLFDFNGDGRISVSEISESLFNGTLTDNNRKDIEAVDTDRNGIINYAEFSSAMRQHPVRRLYNLNHHGRTSQ